MVESIRTTFVSQRRTTGAHSGEHTSAGARIQIDVSPDVQIEPAIAIVVKECGAAVKLCARSGTGNSSFISDIGERSVPVVMIKNVATVLRNKQVRKPVVVVISPDAA